MELTGLHRSLNLREITSEGVTGRNGGLFEELYSLMFLAVDIEIYRYSNGEEGIIAAHPGGQDAV